MSSLSFCRRVFTTRSSGGKRIKGNGGGSELKYDIFDIL
jgi:hypothetical protein